ncbi:low molecular weight phosphotyrosine protein phosphatase [Caldibacillus lycopersici]|uniref:protein-tyrosine-phosphatase n=1 Tax=Perspicuibacillus lycopersici TaxID=1325689 RepID=A0AAE3IU81_9BACI|nr:low molecular weight protein-tyrosine-phosphatase [Perspicuibacillus lycopersici]MCU9614512.1 low molecular weight phosphotyrosine protein phosphatase [Perspicuibacillus lycopersici]
MITVLFVCLGNICRSPMAEAIFRELVKKEGMESKFRIDSAGLGNWHAGDSPHQGTRNILRKNQISSEGIVARQITATDLTNFDYIIAMDDDNIEGIRKLQKAEPTSFVGKLLDFVDEEVEKNVPDPYYTGNFEVVYELVTKGCELLLEKIKAEHNIRQ